MALNKLRVNDYSATRTTKINKVIDDVNLKAPLASPTFTGTLGFTGAVANFAPSASANAALELGYIGGGATTPFIDFHSGATAVDYDSRIIASGGTGSSGGGALTIQATLVVISTNINMEGLPTSDPMVASRIWNNSGVLNISSG